MEPMLDILYHTTNINIVDVRYWLDTNTLLPPSKGKKILKVILKCWVEKVCVSFRVLLSIISILPSLSCPNHTCPSRSSHMRCLASRVFDASSGYIPTGWCLDPAIHQCPFYLPYKWSQHLPSFCDAEGGTCVCQSSQEDLHVWFWLAELSATSVELD